MSEPAHDEAEVGTESAEDDAPDSAPAEEPEADAPEEEAEEEEAPVLEDLKKTQLQRIAAAMGLDLPSRTTKPQLVAAIRGDSAAEAPVAEILPILRVGDWVRLAADSAVPRHLVNLDAVVVRALVKRAQGGDVLSPTPYEYQDGTEEFLVRVRETGDELTITRDAVARHGTQQAELVAA